MSSSFLSRFQHHRIMRDLPWRVSSRPAKQLLYMWLAQDMRGLSGDVGLDAGCGDMSNRQYFRTQRYVGVDADAARLHAALDKIDDSRVEDALGSQMPLGRRGVARAARRALWTSLSMTCVERPSQGFQRPSARLRKSRP
jgi:hypothetical protein